MWVALVLLGLLLLAGFGGVTGRRVFDSRDPAFSMKLPVPKPRSAIDLLDPDGQPLNQ